MTDEITTNVEVAAEAVASPVSFQDSIPESYRSEPSLEGIQDMEGLVKGYIHSQKMIGSSVRIPGEDASSESVEEFYTKLQTIPGVIRIADEDNAEGRADLYSKLGRPTEATAYKLENAGSVDADSLTNFKDAAFEAGLSNTQADKLMNFYKDAVIEPSLQNFEDARSNGESVLKEKWGNDYEARMQGAKLAASKYSEKYPDAMKNLVNGIEGSNPAFIEILSDLARSMSETDVIKGLQKTQYGMSSEEALDKIQEIKSNMGHAYYDTGNPGHSAAVQKVQSLYSKAYPDEQG